MSKMHKILLFTFFLILSSTSALANDHWSVLGVSPYQQLSRTLFYARLVSKQDISAEDLLKGDTAFQLDVVVSGKSLSARRWRNLLMEGVMINHQLDQLSSYTDDLNKMMGKFTFRLKKGDKFEVQYHPVNGSRVKLNGFDFGDFKQPQFSLLLLRGWIGDVPLSSGFKKALFSDQSRDIQAEMDSFSLTAERREVTSRALSGKPPQAKVAAKTKMQAPSVTEAKKTTPIVASKIATPIAVAVAKPDRLSTPAATEAPVKVDLPEAKASTASAQNTEENSEKSQANELKPPEAKTPPTSSLASADLDRDSQETEDEESAEVVDVMNEELLRLRQDYYRKLVAGVSAKKAIPFKAFQRGWKGEVRIEVTINRIGEVLEATVLEPSRYELFNEQAITAAKSAQPLPEMPTEIQGEKFTFSVPLSYSFIK